MPEPHSVDGDLNPKQAEQSATPVAPGPSGGQTDRHPHRRQALLMGGVAVAAAAAGLAWSLRRPSEDQPSATPAAGEAAALASLWGMRFDGPAGESVDLANFKGKPLVLNFWATWCPPCVEEMPLLDRFHIENKANGWQVLGLAIDQPSSVRQFLTRVPVQFPIGLAGLEGTALGRSLGNLTGGLPFTVVFGRDAQVAQRKMGAVTPQDLKAWASLA
jgi:thiol-disulfide isomerase/thioredoxin